MRLVPYIASGIAFAAWACALPCHAIEPGGLAVAESEGHIRRLAVQDGLGADSRLLLHVRRSEERIAHLSFRPKDGHGSSELSRLVGGVPAAHTAGAAFAFWFSVVVLLVFWIERLIAVRAPASGREPRTQARV